MEKEEIRNIGLFTINAQCNDYCRFCIKSEFMKKSYPDLTLQEIKNNYFFIKNSYKIHQLVISGGEPTIHSEFFKILDFFNDQGVNIGLVTNLLKINDKSFFRILKKYFPDNGNNMIIASINNLPSFSNNSQARINGLIKVLKSQLRFAITIIIYKDNVNDLPKLASLLKKNIEKYYSNKINFEIELRSLYFSETPELILKQVLPINNAQIKIAIEGFLEVWRNSELNVNIMPWRFPLCYIKSFDKINREALKVRRNSRYILVDKIHQLKKIGMSDIIEQGTMCPECVLNDRCAALDYLLYQEKYQLPTLSPIKNINKLGQT